MWRWAVRWLLDLASGSKVRSSAMTSSLTQSVCSASRASCAVSTASAAPRQPAVLGSGVELPAQQPAQQWQRPRPASQPRGEQELHIADVVAADRHGQQVLGPVQCVNLRRRAVLRIGEHIGSGCAGIRHVDEFVSQLRGDQVRIVARRAACPERRAVGGRPDARA